MRDASDIQIQELIIHILDPHGQGLVLSDIPVPLDDNPELREFFTRHIENAFNEPSIKPARFRNINPEQPSGACRDLLRGERALAEGSQALAHALYPLLERDRRITAGDLAVCLFSAGNYPYSRFLAILKLDPALIFRHVTRQDSQGRTFVSFEPLPQAFSTERLQKCAFIQPLEPRHPEYDMLLLDRQVASLEDMQVARFFSESFLDAEPVNDARKFSELFYKGLVNAQNQVRGQLSPEEDEALEDGIRDAMSSRRVNLDAWLEALPVAEAARETIADTVGLRIAQREFPIDRTYSQRLLGKVKFRGEQGLRLEVPAEVYRALVVSEEYVTDDPGREPYYRIVIETEEWKRMA